MEDQDLQKLVDRAQTSLLEETSVIGIDDVMSWIEGRTANSVVADMERIRTVLDKHPGLISAASGGGLWRRGVNSGPPRRRPISRGR